MECLELEERHEQNHGYADLYSENCGNRSEYLNKDAELL